MLRAATTVAAPRLLAESAVAVPLTGTTSETPMATITIPAGALGLNGGVQIRTSWSYPNSANTKALRIRLGGVSGTQYLNVTNTTSVSFGDFRSIKNRGAANSQIGSAQANNQFGSSGSALVTSSVDTSVSVDLVISGQLSSAAETLTLEMYEVWLLP